jgi:hypothetical protein
MFNLIISIVAIALIVVLAMASLWHGGTAFNDNKVVADAARYRNEAVQIASAITLFKGDGNEITDAFKLQDLVDKGYLKTLPIGWQPGSNKIMYPLDSGDTAAEHICITAIQQSGYAFDPTDTQVDAYSSDPTIGIPHCDKTGLDPMVPCCVNKSTS